MAELLRNEENVTTDDDEIEDFQEEELDNIFWVYFKQSYSQSAFKANWLIVLITIDCLKINFIYVD